MNPTEAHLRRIFFAIPADIEDAGPLEPVLEALKRNAGIAKAVMPVNYHITLKFLGPVEEEKYRGIMDAFMSLPIGRKALPYQLEGIGAFPDVARAAVIWCGIRADTRSIADMQKKIEGLARPFGFDKEKRQFTPHLTIARLKKGARITDDLAGFINDHRNSSFGGSVFKRIVLYESELTPQGPIYTPLAVRELGEG